MKNLFLFLLLTLNSLTCIYAQNETTVSTELKELCNQEFVELKVDFSNASIHNMAEEYFAIYEPSYSEKKLEVIAKLAEGFNDDKRKPFIVGMFTKALFTIKVNVIHIDTNGDMNSKAEILDRDGNLLAGLGSLYGEGGNFGSKMNLIGDGCLSTGEALSKKVKKLIKTLKKKK